MVLFEFLGMIDLSKVSYIGLIKEVDRSILEKLYYFEVIIDSQLMKFSFKSKENAKESQQSLIMQRNKI